MLSAVSSYTVSLAKKNNNNFILLALMPLFFGTQQIIEGFVWLGFIWNNKFLVHIAAIGFTFFAFALWPVFAPLSIVAAEKKRDPGVAELLKVLVVIGAIIAAAAYLPVILGLNPLHATIIHNSISYDTRAPQWLKDAYVTLYVFVVIVPFISAKMIKLKLFGVLLLMSSVLANFIWGLTFISVWCFFAAILSLFMIYILKDEKSD